MLRRLEAALESRKVPSFYGQTTGEPGRKHHKNHGKTMEKLWKKHGFKGGNLPKLDDEVL